MESKIASLILLSSFLRFIRFLVLHAVGPCISSKFAVIATQLLYNGKFDSGSLWYSIREKATAFIKCASKNVFGGPVPALVFFRPPKLNKTLILFNLIFAAKVNAFLPLPEIRQSVLLPGPAFRRPGTSRQRGRQSEPRGSTARWAVLGSPRKSSVFCKNVISHFRLYSARGTGYGRGASKALKTNAFFTSETAKKYRSDRPLGKTSVGKRRKLFRMRPSSSGRSRRRPAPRHPPP